VNKEIMSKICTLGETIGLLFWGTVIVFLIALYFGCFIATLIVSLLLCAEIIVIMIGSYAQIWKLADVGYFEVVEGYGVRGEEVETKILDK